MNIGEFFRQQIIRWNNVDKCGYCWEYGMPLTDSAANSTKLQDGDCADCCVIVFLTGLSIVENKSFADNGLLNQFFEDYTFTVHYVKRDKIGVNNYSEQDYPISESRWEEILHPLRECVKGSDPFDFCEIVGRDVDILNVSWDMRILWTDNNLTGWSVTYTIRTDGDPYTIIDQTL